VTLCQVGIAGPTPLRLSSPALPSWRSKLDFPGWTELHEWRECSVDGLPDVPHVPLALGGPVHPQAGVGWRPTYLRVWDRRVVRPAWAMHAIAALPEFAWKLSLAVWIIFNGFNRSDLVSASA